MWGKGPHRRKCENGVAWLDVAAVALVGGNTSDTIKRGVTTKSVESICSVELSHLARPLSIGILLSSYISCTSVAARDAPFGKPPAQCLKVGDRFHTVVQRPEAA